MISNTLIALATVCLCAQLGAEASGLSTNIAVLNAGDSRAELANAMTTVVDPSSLLASAGEPAKDGDIQEDPRDRFITTRSGKRRPMLMSDSEASEWAEDVPAAKLRKLEDGDDTGSIAARVLSRVKRCGGGGGDDDGGDARRARARARRIRRARKQAAKVKTTTVTKKVYQNGQVVSETTYAQPQVVVAPGAPMVQSVAPVVQTVPQPIQQQPVIIQQQPVAAPVVQQAPAVAAAPQVVQQQGIPSISVQGSVKVN